MKRKAMIAMLSTTMMVSVLGGCSAKEEPKKDQVKSESTNSESKKEDSKKEVAESKADEVVTLKWYMSINPVAPDTAKVIEELNKYTREKIGVEIEYTVMANPDYQEKMPTYINSGEYFDICFTSNWTTNYLQFVGREAFMDITDLLAEHAGATYDFIPEMMWDAVSVDGSIYGVPTYKEMGWQSGFFVNSDMAKEYGIDLSTVKTLADYTDVLKVVEEKSKTQGKDVIGVSGLSYALAVPYESLTGTPTLPGASAVSEYGIFEDQEEVFNQYTTQSYMDYCELVYGWNQAGYTSADPINYDADTANRDNDFNNGNLFSYLISYAPGAAEAASITSGHGVEFVPLMDPLFETRNAMGGILAISSGSEHPEKALEFLNLLNTDEYVGTLIRHGIEGEHHSLVGDTQVDKTMGGTLPVDQNGYDYTFGWQFGTPFNQKWDISYPENIEELFDEYNEGAIVSPHNGFTFNTSPAETAIAAITNVIAEYGPALESGSVNPQDNIPKFLEALESNGVETLLTEIDTQIGTWKTTK